MSNTTATAVPTAETVTRAAGAVLAAERLTEALAGAKGASAAFIVKRYGADVDLIAVRLAKRAADEISGAAKSRGEARMDVLAVLHTVESYDTITDVVLVAAARARLDANAKGKRDRTAAKRELAAKVNDSAATEEQRHAALSVLTGMDNADKDAKRVAAEAAFSAACAAAVKNGVSSQFMSKAIGTATGV